VELLKEQGQQLDTGTPVQYRELAVTPRFDAGDSPNNEFLYGYDAATIPDTAVENAPPVVTNGPAPAPAEPAAIPLPIIPPLSKKEPKPQPPAGPSLPLPAASAPADKPASGDVAGNPLDQTPRPSDPIAVKPVGAPGTPEPAPRGEVGAKHFVQLADGLARDIGAAGPAGPEQTVYWDPAAATDAQGKARLRLKLPAGPGYYKLRVTADRGGEVITTERIYRVAK
jgi:hypothetical protein